MCTDNKKAATLRVGILAAPEINFSLHGSYVDAHGNAVAPGRHTATVAADGSITVDGAPASKYRATVPGDFIELEVVVIGVDFHWQRRENQRFSGNLEFVVEKGTLTAVNVVDVEEYLKSVISSEMSASASPALLRAHAVISRSCLLAQIEKHHKLTGSGVDQKTMMVITDSEINRWQDREDHVLFDVCADDHCQRYQGITRQTNPDVAAAVDDTRGMVLTDSAGNLADARFSKCCGGVFEEFENCWEPEHHDYLEAARDSADSTDFPDLTIEENARKWILGSPEAFCNTTDATILGQVLNNYDLETPDFYRWTVRYSREVLSELIARRTGIDFGTIEALEPLERGTSGRITRLRVVGSRRTMVLGKELEIRHALSESHLYSSAFVVESDADGFTLRGAGWGHGVGLYQIGAAVMGARGYDYRAILAHYFHNTTLATIY